MKVHEKTNKQICGELLDEIIDKVISTTKRKHDEDEEDQPMIKKKCNVLDDEELERDMINDNEEYNCKLALGEKVYKIVKKGKVKKESLTLERKEAFELYRERNVEQLDEKEKEKKDIEFEYDNEIESEAEKEKVIEGENMISAIWACYHCNRWEIEERCQICDAEGTLNPKI